MKNSLLCVFLLMPALAACAPSDVEHAAEVPPIMMDAPMETSPPPLPDPEKLKGLSPAAVQALMGVPELVHRANHAQTMLFRGKACVLDLYFYEDVTGEGFALKWYEARNFKGNAIEAALCVQALLPDGQGL